MDREELGKIVHEAWTKYRAEGGDVHAPAWDDLSDADREGSCRAGEAVQEALDALLEAQHKQIDITHHFQRDYELLVAAQSCTHLWSETGNNYWCVKCGATFKPPTNQREA